MNIILASTSPRRQQLLKQAGVEFTTCAVDIDETVKEHELPQDYIVRMVSDKSKAACHLICNKGGDKTIGRNSDRNEAEKGKGTQITTDLTLIITSDTIGVLPDGKSILVKPRDKSDAFSMWSKMANSEHTIWTAVQLTVVDTVGNEIKKETLLEKTEVSFMPLTVQQMDDYWNSGEPQDKAGAYAIQGKGAAWVKRINGSYTNVVGLPLAQTLAAIERITDDI